MKRISIKNLEWRPDKKSNSILSGINLDLECGGIYGILGPNGAGKTSLIRQILGLVNCDAGEIRYDDRLLSELSRQEISTKISVLSQNYNMNGVNADFTVFDIICMGREPHRKHFKPLDNSDMEIIEEAMEITDCSHLKDKSITKLSGGELQRVMIARTIAQDTPWIILDEPVSSLDVRHQTEIMKVLEKLHKEKGKTIIAILHDINLAIRYCTEFIFLKEGKIVAKGDMDSVITHETLKKVYDIDFAFIKQDDSLFVFSNFM